MSNSYLTIKRVLDLFVSATALLALAPLFILLAACVALTSPGGPLYRQQRVGRHGKAFTLFKFRSMREAAPGPAVTASSDPRITAVGRVLRRYKLDELPQLYNVLRGDMSLIGPRPEVRRYVDLFPEEYARILTVRPGLTDFAAIEYRNEEEILRSHPDPERAYIAHVLPAKLALYQRYLDECSFRTDAYLLAATLAALVRPAPQDSRP